MPQIKISALKPYPKNARTHNPKQIRQIAKSIQEFGFTNPVLIDKDNCILAGHGRVEAAKLAGLTEVPAVVISHLTPAQKKAYILADNRLAELSGWDKNILKVELEELQRIEDGDFDLTLTGFETPEIDVLLAPPDAPAPENANFLEKSIPARVKSGDLWQLGAHKLLCADSTQPASFCRLLGEEKANLIVTDPPYNVKISGHVRSGEKYREFAMASGEMSQSEFSQFLKGVFTLLSEYSIPGSLHYAFMDWRHMGEILSAGMSAYTALKNVCVWNKLSGGMGSLYRSQHELVFVFKNGDAPHTNNIELGVHARYRTNVWDYPGIFIKNKVNKANINLHPTVKPVGLLADILLDASPRKGLVLDPFGGSGSTLLAAERTGRQARIIEIDPHYCDVILYRYEQMGGKELKLLQREDINENTKK
ncbi:site-specific DNA-methyltransferase [Candidatus Avelusimicrobium sp.]|uniref:site-specific DNA-methyltransferase n=1 Tax=Candidatus Avelusimicrobium sp. TaxID=3048833 RepID=UPI003F81C2F2